MTLPRFETHSEEQDYWEWVEWHPDYVHYVLAYDSEYDLWGSYRNDEAAEVFMADDDTWWITCDQFRLPAHWAMIGTADQG
jgi:hypothetical protein